MPFIELQTVDSTNNYAFSQIHAGLAQHGMTFFAQQQTAGKGQRGRKWVSSRGQNIILSIIVKPAPLIISEQFRLSACAAVSAREFLSKYAGENVTIKWPNDIYWKDRKAGGILIESIVRSQSEVESRQSTVDSRKPAGGAWDWAVVGIGINVNQDSFPPGLSNPVSLRQITGEQFDPVELSKELCCMFDRHFDRLIHEGFEGIFQQYVHHLYKRGETVKLKKDNRVFEAVIRGVSTSGRLIVRHAIEEEFDFGTIEWVIQS